MSHALSEATYPTNFSVGQAVFCTQKGYSRVAVVTEARKHGIYLVRFNETEDAYALDEHLSLITQETIATLMAQ